MANGAKLRGELSVYRNCLGEPSPSAAICGACNSTADLVELRTPVRGITGAIFYRMDCRPHASPRFLWCVYAAIFVLVNSAYLAFAWEVLAQAEVQEKVSARTRQMTRVRSFMTLGMFVIAMVLSFKFPFWGFGLVACVLFAYLRPEASGGRS